MQIKGTKLIFQKKSSDSVLQWLPVLFFLFNVYMRTGHSSSLYLITLLVTGIIGLLILMSTRSVRSDVLYITIAIYFISGIFNFLIIGNVSLIDLANDALLFGVMSLMLLHPMDLKKGTVFFYISIVTFVYAYFTGTQASSVLTSSGNYVSVLMILSAAVYYISFYNSKKDLKLVHLLPALLCFLFSVWAKGRGGILACAVLFVLLLLYYLICYAQSGGSKRIVFLAVVVIIAVTYLYIKNINLIDAFFSLGKWSYRGVDNTAREIIWGAYFEKMKESFLYILNGAPLDQIPIIHSLNNNTHNSFIQLHANNGLIPFILFTIFMIRSFFYYIKNKEFLLAIVLFAVFIRGMSDKFIFGQYGMPIMMYLVLFPYIEQRRRVYNLEQNIASYIQ